MVRITSRKEAKLALPRIIFILLNIKLISARALLAYIVTVENKLIIIQLEDINLKEREEPLYNYVITYKDFKKFIDNKKTLIIN